MSASLTPPLASWLTASAQEPHAAQADILASTRRAAGLTQVARAQICQVSPRQYGRYEQGVVILPLARRSALYQHATTHLIQHRPANKNGRDFIVGDLHGHGRLLLSMLEDLAFDPECDRVFSVGDLTDHGPESLSTLRLLRAPWFHAVRGNHEDLLWDYAQGLYEYGPPDTDHPFLHNGGNWFRQLNADARTEWVTQIAPRIALLPHILIIGSGVQRYHIVHAELDGPACRITNAVLDEIADTGHGVLPQDRVAGPPAGDVSARGCCRPR